MLEKARDQIRQNSLWMPFCGCWLWTKSLRNGYGQINWSGEEEKQAHRISYKAFKGEIPEGLDVCHTCDTPSCVNPEHLEVKSRKGNMEDAVKRGRTAKGKKSGMFGRTGKKHPTFGKCVNGEKHPKAKFKTHQIVEILIKYKAGLSIHKIAKNYRVSRPTIRAITQGKTWKHIPRSPSVNRQAL